MAWEPKRTEFRLLLISAVLAVGVFTLDLWLPLGVADGVLYLGVVLVSCTSSQRRFPVVVAGACSVLMIAGAVFSPTLPNVPLWIGIINRLLSLMVIWVPALVIMERRRGEERLRAAYGELETRVQERTVDLVKANDALAAEVAERVRAEDKLRSLAAQLINAQEEERRRISRDLHDDVSQRLAMLTVEVETLEQNLRAFPEQFRARLRQLRRQVGGLSDDVRHMAYQFHPSILDDLGLPIALKRYVDDLSARTGLRGTFVQRNLAERLPQDVSSCLYRVAQESLGNVSKHSRATQFTVELVGSEEGISLSVRDSGVGFSPELAKPPNGGLGLISMKERVRLVSGTLEVLSRPGEGTHVRVWVPLSGRSA